MTASRQLARPKSGGELHHPTCPFWGGAFLASIYFFRYRVVITDTPLTLGSLRRPQLIFDDVIDWDVIRGGRSSELVIYLRAISDHTLVPLHTDLDQNDEPEVAQRGRSLDAYQAT